MLRNHQNRPAPSAARLPPPAPISAAITLLHWNDLPPWRRDNSYIHTGYRPSLASLRSCFASLFYLHNETVNIYSHLLGAILFLGTAGYLYSVITPRYATATAIDIVVFGAFLLGGISCLGMSATYHAVSCHSEVIAKWGNKLDYTGIVFLIVGSYIPALYYGFFCDPILMETYLTAITTLGFGCILVSWVERFRTPAWRPYRAAMFVGLGASGVLPILQGLEKYGWDYLRQTMGLDLVILHGALYIVGAVLYATRWPERSWPGAFDIFGSSHQIFHGFVLLAALTHLYAMTWAFDHHHTIMDRTCSF